MRLIVTAVILAVVMVVMVTAATLGREEKDRPLVEVDNGLMRGLTTTLYNTTYLEFLGIPYAIPPVGSLRFKVINKHTKT